MSFVDPMDTAVVHFAPELLGMAQHLPAEILGSVDSRFYAPTVAILIRYVGGKGRTVQAIVRREPDKTTFELQPTWEAQS